MRRSGKQNGRHAMSHTPETCPGYKNSSTVSPTFRPARKRSEFGPACSNRFFLSWGVVLGTLSPRSHKSVGQECFKSIQASFHDPSTFHTLYKSSLALTHYIFLPHNNHSTPLIPKHTHPSHSPLVNHFPSLCRQNRKTLAISHAF